MPLGARSSENVTESLEPPTEMPAGAAGCVETRSCVTSVNAYVASRPFDCADMRVRELDSREVLLLEAVPCAGERQLGEAGHLFAHSTTLGTTK